MDNYLVLLLIVSIFLVMYYFKDQVDTNKFTKCTGSKKCSIKKPNSKDIGTTENSNISDDSDFSEQVTIGSNIDTNIESNIFDSELDISENSIASNKSNISLNKSNNSAIYNSELSGIDDMKSNSDFDDDIDDSNI